VLRRPAVPNRFGRQAPERASTGTGEQEEVFLNLRIEAPQKRDFPALLALLQKLLAAAVAECG
jgi:hypothetical protein